MRAKEQDNQIGFKFDPDMTEDSNSNMPEGVKFDKIKTMQKLGIKEGKFETPVQGYSHDREVHINPDTKFPLRVLWHEMAHIVLGHTKDSRYATDKRYRAIYEVEAETVALQLAGVFGYDEAMPESINYIKEWIPSEGMPEQSSARVAKAAFEIMQANLEGVA